MQISLLTEKDIFAEILPEKPQGQFWLTFNNHEDNEEKLLRIEGVNGNWYLKSNKNAQVVDEKGEALKDCPIRAGEIYRVQLQSSNESVLIHAENVTEDRQLFKKVVLPTSGKITIGRNEASDIQYKNKFVSSNHSEIHIEQNELRLKSLSQSNGTYVNNVKVDEVALKPGDVIYIIGFKIIVGKGFISINNPDQHINYNQTVLKTFKKRDIVEDDQLFEDIDESEQTVFKTYFRSPRFKRSVESKEFKIDPPPAPNMKEETPLLLMLGPAMTMGIASLVTAFFTLQYALNNGSNMRFVVPTIAMAFSMLIGTVLFPIIMRKHERKKRIRYENMRQEKYKEYLQKMDELISEDAKVQSAILHENYLHVSESSNYIVEGSTNLWERTINRKDFLTLRLGLGDLPHSVNVKYPDEKFSLEDDHLQDLVQQMANEPKLLKNVPITVPLQTHRALGVIGQSKYTRQFAKSLIMQLVSLHSYDELKLVFIYDKKETNNWEFTKWLPHVWNKENDVRFMATEQNEVRELNSYLDKEFKKRVELLKQGKETISSHILIFALGRILSLKADVLNSIYEEKIDVKMSVVNLCTELSELPKESSIVIELNQKYGKIYNKNNSTGDIQTFIPEYYTQQNELKLARKLANIRLLNSESDFLLPERLTFLEMFGVGMVEHLNPLSRWQLNDPTSTLQTRIGVGTNGDWASLDLHEKFHGPHGLIAGMTGSGKSEFIMTYILSLAVNYHPEEVAFILIDYKGGGMASAFTKLPHLAGTITNLDGRAVNRSLVSIQSELKRRQKVFNDAGRKFEVSNIDIYKYQKLYREGRVSESLPHLFIISDEFAELKTQQPEFMAQLISAARIGRSLGIHLILATQKPSGVVDDQIWSNSKFRVSLKVQERADSMDVIKRPDAAELTVTGRYYLSVGYNELFELGQSAWSGAPYFPTEKAEKSVENRIVIINQLGRKVSEYQPENRTRLNPNPPKQIDQIVKYLEKIATEENIAIRPIWLDPIPAITYLDDLWSKYEFEAKNSYDLQTIIGEFDDPDNQLQGPLVFDLNQNGNTIIYGAADSGKTTFLTTMLVSFMKSNTPNEVNFYILDFGAETLRAFEQAPHIGEILISDDSEKINNLFKLLSKELLLRKKEFSNYGGDYSSYLRTGQADNPQMVVMIHNYSNFTEGYQEYEEQIAILAREGTKYGIYFILTATNGSAIRYRISQNFKQQYVLQLNDDSDYTGILGNIKGVYPTKYKGRGILKSDAVYEFQTAYAFENVEHIFDDVKAFCGQLALSWNGIPARKVPILPEKIDLKFVRESFNYLKRYEYPIGVNKDSLELNTVDFTKETIQFVSGNSVESSSYLQGLAEVIAEKGNSDVVYVSCGETFYGPIPDHYEVINEAFGSFAVRMFNSMVDRNNRYKEAIEAKEIPPVYTDLTVVIQSFSTFLQKLNADELEKIKLVLEKGELHYNIRFILADNVNQLTNYSTDAWYKSRLTFTQMIWIGNGIAEQYQIPTKTSARLRQEIPEDFGYKVVNGRTVLIKLLTSQFEEKLELLEV